MNSEIDTYAITYSFQPGPTEILPEVLQAYNYSGPPKEFSTEFYKKYGTVQDKLAQILNVKEDGRVIIECGEAMLGLWGALKSVIKANETRVLSVANGIYGYGFTDMATSLGAIVETVGIKNFDEVITDISEIENKLSSFKPHLVTMVHCETPSGLLNPIEEIGKLVEKQGDCLLCVDCVSSAFGVKVDVQKLNIDICLIGSQKCLSLLPDLTIISITEKAWNVIDQVDYKGYDALKPWKNAPHETTFPYTHNYRSVDALSIALEILEKEGLDQVFLRHNEVANYCQQRIIDMGLSLFPKQRSFSSPTVTAVIVPEGWNWDSLNAALRNSGVMFSGNMGELKNKVFRIGHMGVQCDKKKVKEALDILEDILKSKL